MSARPDDLTIISAGAGSGKTYTLQQQVADWIADGHVAPESLAAMTFTRAAANELRDRIRAELIHRGLLSEARSFDEAYVSTIHGFGSRLVSEFCFEVGLAPHLRQVEGPEQRILLRTTISRIRDRITIAKDLRRHGFRDRYETGERVSGAECFQGSLERIIAKLRTIGAAGTGDHNAFLSSKTVQDLYPHVVDNGGPLGDILHRAVFRALEAAPGDPTSHFYEVKTVWPDVAKDYRALLDARDRSRLDWDWELWKRLRKQQKPLLKSKIGKKLDFAADYDERWTEVCAAADALARHPGPYRDTLRIAREMLEAGVLAGQDYQETKGPSGLIDYGDMLSLAWEIVGIPEVVADLKRRIKLLVVDEFQDTNPLEFTMLWRLHTAGIPMLVVGDLKQAIMSVQDADPRLFAAMLEAHSDIAGSLPRNWRTATEIMDWVNAVGPGLFPGGYDALAPQKGSSANPAPLTIWKIGRAQKKPKITRPQMLASFVRDLLDSEEMVRPKRGEPRPICGGDVAMLFQTGTMIQKYSAALEEIGIPTVIPRDGWRESRELQVARQALAFVADPEDGHAALYLAVTELGCSSLQDAISRLLEGRLPDDPVLDTLLEVSKGRHRAAVPDLVDETIRALDLHDLIARWPDAAQARANLLRLSHEARSFMEAPAEALDAQGIHGGDLRSFLAWLDLRTKDDDGMPRSRVADRDAVTLSTWHSAKGLEWNVVVVGELGYRWKPRLPASVVEYQSFDDLNRVLDGARVQYYPASDVAEVAERFMEPLAEASREEQRRLLYVALTRARQKLILDWSLGKPDARFQDLLLDAGVALNGNIFSVRDLDFDVDVVEWKGLVDSEAEDEELEAIPDTLPNRRVQIPAYPRAEDAIPLEVTPSSLEGGSAALGDPTNQPIHDGLDLGLDLPATERGSLIHRAFEILGAAPSARDDLSDLLDFSFDDDQLDRLVAISGKFETWIQDHFRPLSVRREVQVSGLDARGTVITGVIDLLVETSEGFWVLDHKSDEWKGPLDNRFAHYAPQLDAYRVAVESQADKPVIGVGIHWIYRGICSLVGL